MATDSKKQLAEAKSGQAGQKSDEPKQGPQKPDAQKGEAQKKDAPGQKTVFYDKPSEIVPDFLKNINFALAARQALWALSILVCLFGIFATLAGTASLWMSVGFMHESVSAPLDAAIVGSGDIGASISPIEGSLESASNASGKLSSALRNFSASLGGVKNSLRSLASIPGIGGSLNLEPTIAQLDSASLSLAGGADDVDNVALGLQGERGVLAKLKADVGNARQSIIDAKDSISSAFGWMQIGIAVMGLALCAMFSSVLMLALAVGFPKKIG